MNPAPPVTTIVLTGRPAYLRRAKDRSSSGNLDDARRPRVGRVRLLHPLPEPPPERCALLRIEAGEPLEPVGKLLRRFAREAQLVVENVRKARVGSKHRQAR